MAKPVLLALDDEPHVLNAVERDLRRRFGRDYRILKAGSGVEALETLHELKARNEPVALFLSDQRMPGMGGIDFLRQAIVLYPDAQRRRWSRRPAVPAAYGCPSSSSRTGRRWSNPTPGRWRRRWACTAGPASRSTTWRLSAAGRPGETVFRVRLPVA